MTKGKTAEEWVFFSLIDCEHGSGVQRRDCTGCLTSNFESAMLQARQEALEEAAVVVERVGQRYSAHAIRELATT